ncbi:MAG TPA: galactose oxidase-like domain-containing protein [Steroidobacteraceae bacterium]|nr:galactose oxidase-like domain-containing protein [Steroidobacteraceae bacterium]
MRYNLRSTLVIAGLAGSLLCARAGAQSCAVNVPHITGTWVVLPYQMPINPISATMLPTGKVLLVAGSENDATNNSKGAESYRAAVWDPTGTTESSIAVKNLNYDVFCSGTAALPDGRSLIVGGTSDYTFTGENRASIFNPISGEFIQSQNMANGRWYASALALGDGRVMAMSGLTLTGGTNTTIEIYDLRSAGTGWGAPTSVPFTPPLYPRIFLLPNGKVFYTGQGQSSSTANSWIFDPAAAGWTVSAPTTANRMSGSSVLLPLLPPNYTPHVINFGGGSPATSTTELIDLSASSPSWTPGPNMSTGRIQMNAVLLPNGNVLAEGGSVNNESPDTLGKTADLYDPGSNTIRSGGSGGTAAYSRLYHSTALLLPDATVMSMGSNPGARGSYEAAIEIYTPPYLFDATDHPITNNRPNITGISSTLVGYNALLSVSYTSTSAISSAVLMRVGSDTHAFDMEQRMVGLCGPTPEQPTCNGSNNTINLTTPPNGNVAPPGYYMLFLLDSAGVPSKASFIQLTPYSTSAPSGIIASPASDVTISAGATVNFGTSSAAAKYSWIFPGGSPATSTAQNPGNVTFSTPGTYRVSLTLIDSSGNSDSNPPTRQITVNPTGPDFAITVGPSAQQVVPGGAAQFTVAVTPLSGFTGSVNLTVGSESGFPSGITSGGFSPASIIGSGSSVLTMDTTTSTIPWALSLTVTGTSGALTHTASTTLLVNLAPPATIAATPGDGQVALSWPASIGATGYHVKRATVSQGPYVGAACPAGTSYVDTGLNDGTPYYYVISAAFSGNPNAGGESANSGEASATPQAAPPMPPSPPTGLSAKATKPRTLSLQWVQSTSAGVTQNSIYRRTSGTPYSSTPLATISATTAYRDGSVTSRTTYCYVVTAKSAGGQSGNSNESCATAK